LLSGEVLIGSSSRRQVNISDVHDSYKVCIHPPSGALAMIDGLQISSKKSADIDAFFEFGKKGVLIGDQQITWPCI
jgi:hypothetical protein